MKCKYREKKYMKKMLMIFTFCAAFIVSGNMKNVQAAEWYDNYDYTLDNSAKTITLRASKGTLGATATVPGNATINGVSYTTVLDNSGSGISIWDADKTTLTSLTIMDGVKVAAGSTSLFRELSKLRTLDVNGLNTSEMKTMSYMFYKCSELLYLDLSSFNTAKVTDMDYMFYGCKKLIYIDLSSFNTDNVGYMQYMFDGSFGDVMLQDLDLRSFNLNKGSATFIGFLTNSKIVNLYLPKTNCIKNYDLSGLSNLARIYFEGTENEWNMLNNTYGSNVKVIFNHTQREKPSEPQVSNPNTTTWYEDYNYYLDTKNFKLIIMSSKGNGITSAVIPAYTSINGKTYKTVLNNYYARRSTPISLWSNDMESIKEIKIEDGVEVVDECSGLFRFAKKKELTTLSIGSIDTSDVVHMDYMFANISVKSLDLRNMDMSNADTTKIFYDSTITNLYLPQNAMKGYDLSGIGGLKNIYYKGDSTQWASLGNTSGSIKVTNNYTGPLNEKTTEDTNTEAEKTGETVTVSKKTINNIASVISSLKQTKKGRKLKVKYNKFKGATGYQIQYSTSKKFSKKTTFNSKKTSATTKKLKKGKRYYVRVRAYIKTGKKKYYSKWSTVKRSSKIK